MKKSNVSKRIIPVVIGLIPILVLFMPLDAFHIEGLTIVEKRVIAIFLMAAIFWIMEPIPIYATSILIIVLELIVLSDKSMILFRLDEGKPLFCDFLIKKPQMYIYLQLKYQVFLSDFCQ